MEYGSTRYGLSRKGGDKLNKIKQFRERLDITQEELCKMIGVTQSAIAMWENGKTLPRTDKLPKLAEIFNCTIDDLFSETKN